MSSLDLIVLFGTLGFIVIYGVWKTRGSKNIEGYLLGDNSMKWGTIGLSVMATQASAITFLSTPGQAYEDGLRFVQNYFGKLFIFLISYFIFLYSFRFRVSITISRPTPTGTVMYLITVAGITSRHRMCCRNWKVPTST